MTKRKTTMREKATVIGTAIIAAGKAFVSTFKKEIKEKKKKK